MFNKADYNLFNNVEVDELISAFLKDSSLSVNCLEKFIIEFIDYFDLTMLCKNICFDDSYNCLGLYNRFQKKLLINFKLIVDQLSRIDCNDYFLKANICRIILHEIKHILQYKMILEKKNQLFLLFETEFNAINQKIQVKPSEINADIDSALTIAKNYEDTQSSYKKQLNYTYNLIASCHQAGFSISDYCRANDLCFLNLTLIDKVLYGFDVVNGIDLVEKIK